MRVRVAAFGVWDETPRWLETGQLQSLPLTVGVISHRDNLLILELSCCGVQEKFDALARVFQDCGMEPAGLASTVLGVEVADGCARPQKNKVATLRRALEVLAHTCVLCSGTAMREVIGRYLAASRLGRGAYALPKASNTMSDVPEEQLS